MKAKAIMKGISAMPAGEKYALCVRRKELSGTTVKLPLGGEINDNIPRPYHWQDDAHMYVLVNGIWYLADSIDFDFL